MEIFGTVVDFNSNESRNFIIENLIAFPSGMDESKAGTVIFHKNLKKFYGWTGTQWDPLN
jgi:hypothetical protein